MHAHENVNQLIIGHRCCTNLYNINTTLEHHLKQSHKRLAVQSYIKASVALFLAVNLVVFALASACGGNCPTPTPSTPSTPTLTTPGSNGRCPRDALKLGVCANVLGLIKAKVAVPPTEPCCPLLEGLVDLEAAVCLCTAIKGNILGINLNLPVDLSLILNHCGKSVPAGFKC